MADDTQARTSKEINILVEGKPVTLSLTAEGQVSASHASALQNTPLYNVIWAEIKDNELELSYINRGKKGKQSALVRASWKIDGTRNDEAKAWCEAVMAEAYKGIGRQRRLRILVNPHGGRGKARQIYEKTVEPIFRAARCSIDTTFTERAKHALELAKELSLEYDALVLLSGDGLLHEVYNGFSEHKDPLGAFAIPVAPIPTGSANGMALNILGLEDGFDVAIACLNAIKGKQMKQDIFSITLGDKRVFAYFSITLGLMADLDLGTEPLRWMGDIRFILGYIYGVLKLKPCPLTLEYKLAESDKDRMVEEFRTRNEEHWLAQHTEELETLVHDVSADALPVLMHSESSREGSDEGWIKFDKPLVYFYAGSAPYVARDLMQFPVAHASDGLIDIVAQELTSRGELLKAIDGAEKGVPFWLDTQHYFKVHAFRITPHDTTGNLAIDGERYPLQPFTVECHRAMGTLLSPLGRYACEFDVPRPEVNVKVKGKSRNRDGNGVGGERPLAEQGEHLEGEDVEAVGEGESEEHGPSKKGGLRSLLCCC